MIKGFGFKFSKIKQHLYDNGDFVSSLMLCERADIRDQDGVNTNLSDGRSIVSTSYCWGIATTGNQDEINRYSRHLILQRLP